MGYAPSAVCCVSVPFHVAGIGATGQKFESPVASTGQKSQNSAKCPAPTPNCIKNVPRQRPTASKVSRANAVQPAFVTKFEGPAASTGQKLEGASAPRDKNLKTVPSVPRQRPTTPKVSRARVVQLASPNENLLRHHVSDLEGSTNTKKTLPRQQYML